MRDDLRMIDANLNRASEGLRVLEDVARFVLDHAELVGILKSARHDLRAAITSAGIDGLGLAASRDTPGDIGTGISSREGLGGRGERRRETLHDLCGAAASRTAEALRVIEECLKLGDGPSREAGAAVQGIRYQAYTSASRLLLSLGTDRATQWRLCVLVSERLCPGRPWEALVESVLAGGADCVQLREKNLPDRELLRRAQQLVAMTRAAGAAAFINDRVDIALLSGADGVHLGEEDLSVAGARKLCGGRVLVGASTSSIE
ncbi:MAG: thiamine phosphate synthase [Phycisphaerales bacterium]|nr:thiamine phosphate synthase [Phycisphaerales bacterium]